MSPVDGVLAELRSQRSRVLLRDAVASLMQGWPTVPEKPGTGGSVERTGLPAVLLDPSGRPVGLEQSGPDGAPQRSPVSLRARPSESVVEVLRRAMGREAATRYDPVVVTDPQGRVVGVVPVDVLVARVLPDRLATL